MSSSIEPFTDKRSLAVDFVHAANKKLFVPKPFLESETELMIRDAVQSDASCIADIYNHYIDHTVVTFEEEHVDASEMWNRIVAIQTTDYPFHVFESAVNLISGYAYAVQWKNRSAYRYAAEVSIYLHPDFVGSGIGTKMYQKLIEVLSQKGIHSVMGGIALPNQASVALHEKLGFKKVAHFEELGWKQDRWIDVGYWELDLGNRNPPGCEKES